MSTGNPRTVTGRAYQTVGKSEISAFMCLICCRIPFGCKATPVVLCCWWLGDRKGIQPAFKLRSEITALPLPVGFGTYDSENSSNC